MAHDSPQGIRTVVINQAGAGTTQLLAGQGVDFAIMVVSYVIVMSADGTFSFSDGTDWLTGDLPIAAKGGVAAQGSLSAPLLICGEGRPLSITTTGGAADGHALVSVQ